MRTRKKRGKNLATVTLTQCEIMLACDKYLTSKGYKLGDHSWMKIVLSGKGKKHVKVEVIEELQN